MGIDKDKGIMFILSAPSGAGKTTLCRMAVNAFPWMRYSISYTTRRIREGEEDGVDYHFISREIFNKMLERGEFLEWAEVHGHLYGTSKKDLDEILRRGYDVILDIDVQGARKIKGKVGDGVYIFVSPPSLDVCRERLKLRGVDSEEEIKKRLNNAKKELEEAIWYDYIIINNTLDDAFNRLKSIIFAEKCRSFRMKGYLPG